MAKPRPSLDLIISQNTPAPEAPIVEGPIATQPVPDMPGRIAAAPAKAPRQDRPHTTLYLDRATQRTIKEIALQYDKKAHDLYLEGINMMLAHYGRPPIGQGRG